MALEARNISVQVGKARLLDNVSVQVAPGQVVAVLGPNGAGKSTLMRVMAGDLSPSAGEVRLNGRPLHAWKSGQRARIRGVLLQDSTLNFPFTALQVALMGRMPHSKGLESQRDYQIAQEALEVVEARHLENRVYTTLSGGERQRVQLARVLAQIWEAGQARYLLLDEPTSSLDLAHQHSTLRFARRFASAGVGVLMILHDLNLTAQYADHILMLRQGAALAAGTPHEVLTPDTLFRAFGIAVSVIPHPSLPCPLVVSTAEAEVAPMSE